MVSNEFQKMIDGLITAKQRLYLSGGEGIRIIRSHFGRVVKAWDLKSHGVTRAGSNPAGDVHFLLPLFQLNLR